MNGPGDADLRLELLVGRLLLVGVLTAAATLAGGLGVSLAAPASAAGPRLLAAGLVLLMATPVLRVLAAILVYARLRDWAFLTAALAVLVELGITAWYASTR